MPIKSVHSKPMRVLFIALIMLAFTTSLWAQGQVVEGSEVFTAASHQNIGDTTASALPLTPLVQPSDWLLPRVSLPFDNLTLIEASRATSENESTSSPLPPIPLTDSSGVEMIEVFRITTMGASPFPPIPPSPDFQIQINQAGIQPAPEPSTFALGSLAVGFISLVRLNRRKKN
jgi:hypothetical protein